jgi:hypothetical protein
MGEKRQGSLSLRLETETAAGADLRLSSLDQSQATEPQSQAREGERASSYKST